MTDQRFGGIARLYGVAAFERLRRARVCVVGIGGVGSWAVEALARSGIGALTLIDLDDVCVTNTNRQIHATTSTIGQPKVEVMATRVRAIHPACEVETRADFVTESTVEQLVTREYDWVIDAIDHVHNKCHVLARCRALGVSIVTTGGAGGRSNPSLVQLGDLSQTSGDGLLRRVRKRLRREHDFPRDVESWQIPCVYSRERAVFPTPEGGVCDRPPAGAHLRLDCDSGVGTSSFVTGTFGFIAASAVINALASTESPE